MSDRDPFSGESDDPTLVSKIQRWLDKPFVTSGGQSRRATKIFFPPGILEQAARMVARRLVPEWGTTHDLLRDCLSLGMKIRAWQLEDPEFTRLASEFDVHTKLVDMEIRQTDRRDSIDRFKRMLENAKSRDEKNDILGVARGTMEAISEPWFRAEMAELIARNS